MNMSWLVFLVAGALSQGHGFVLQISPSFIETESTKNVVLTCQPGGQTDIESLRIMRILKQDQPPNWHVVAEVEENKGEVTSNDKNVVATGRVGAPSDSFLTLTWSVASADTLGRYRCDVIGFKLNQDIVTEKTPEVSIKERNTTIEELFTFVKEEDAQIDRQLAWMAYNINLTGYNVAYLRTSVNQLSLTVQDLVLTVQDLVSAVRATINTHVVRLWPEGSYGVMATSRGCPSNIGVSWITGYRRHHTESSDANHDQVSPINHLLQPVIEREGSQNFFYQRFCIASASSSNSSWPNGTYCINEYGNNCPQGFESGDIHIDDEDTNSSSSVSGALPAGSYNISGCKIFYCCRADGPTNTSIDLPQDKPFYLYRYGGQCQQVSGMNVTEEFILLDTENIRNNDSYESLVHPDGHAKNDTRLELCYYSPV